MAKTVRNNDNDEIMYVFRYVCVHCMMDGSVYDDKDREKALGILKDISENICIDQTYVDFEGTKYRKTFLTEQGWKSLRELVRDTKYGRKCTKKQKQMLYESCCLMIIKYVELFFRDLGWDTDSMDFQIAEGTGFDIEYMTDRPGRWREYRGRWQEW